MKAYKKDSLNLFKSIARRFATLFLSCFDSSLCRMAPLKML